jgi:hypothetical protein
LKNKILIILLALAFLCPCLQAKEKEPAKLIMGIFLTAAGGVFAYNGFQMADASWPSMNMPSFVTVTTGTGPWTVTTSGVIKNTGNVELRNISLTVYYKDTAGAEITNTTTAVSSTLAPGASTSVNFLPYDIAEEPFFFSVKYTADFDRRMQNFNAPVGIAGSALCAAGVFLICDYIFDLTDFLEKNDAKAQLSMINDGFRLMASKSF